ncbi:alpha/beta hydrolase [Hymenobacter cellulosilyticus]|uniref:Alpha/beta hydrolase n=1 Tax=Hymenobacter cellulosilyticus TaxID=2932248 RepID=A0A8T9QAS6_9BACT|nr:alpha/beta fold hydrolase [Hymenobacter cellulosilyticus]UOQ74666.1 alpha/beta hydrolase [Hymenobacter cellulosilyticus]
MAWFRFHRTSTVARPSRTRYVLWALLLGFLALNAVAFLHAWRFTHFTDEPGTHTDNPEQLSPLDKTWVLLTGIKNPKPRNLVVPAFAFRTVTIPSPNGKLEGWYSPVDNARGTVALFHGYTSNKSKLLTEAGTFRQLGYSVLLVDFAGNGGSEGFQTTVGFRESADVKAVFTFLQEQGSTTPIVLYGASMGAVAILRAESELGVRPAANIVECPYGSMLQTAQNRFGSMHVPAFPMANLLVFWGGVQNGFWAFDLDATQFAKKVTVPTLLMWGEADPRVTRTETDAIFAALQGPKQRHIFPGAGHEPYWRRYPQEWQLTISGFLQQL